MKIIKENCKAEIVEKKSKFICNLYYVETREEADQIISNTKKKYHDARHNCYAYVIYDDEKDMLIVKTNDDGEPSGTAGSPILNALKSNEVVNVLAIVTRYFGGILLGTGGLSRAYKDSTTEAISQTTLYNVEKGYLVDIEISYVNNEKLQHFCRKNNINIIKTEYLNTIKYILEINEEKIKLLKDNFEQDIISLDILRQKMIKSA